MFADDCILLGKATISNASIFAYLLQSYCRASGQKINQSKSLICFSPRTSHNLRQAITQIMGISVTADRLSYLGIPITGRRPRSSDFSFIERRIRDRLDGWQVTGLSMMARITLLRSVLSTLPLYLLSNAAIPLTCLRKIERHFRDFLWASMQDGHGTHLVAWDIVCLPLSEGGLGIQSLIVRRKALIARHATRFMLEPQCLWSSFMHAKYGEWTSAEMPQSSQGQSFFWKEVCRHASDILGSISWMIGDGVSVDVVRDTWISDLPLSRWPTFVSTAIPSGTTVADLIAQEHFRWSTSLLSTLFGEDLYRRILSIPLTQRHTPDVRVWRRSCLPRAPIRDLMRIYRPPAQQRLDVAWLWHLPIHPRVRLFLWKLERDCLPTCSLLSRRGLCIQPTCPLCGSEDESVDHAIFTCPRARQIWQHFGERPWDAASSYASTSFLGTLRRDLESGFHQKVAMRAYIANQIWLSRNHAVFTEETTSSHRIVRTALSLAAEYTIHHSGSDLDSPGLWSSHAAQAANRRTVFISWEPPPLGFIKINFDGSVRGRSASSAFVIRGPYGELLAAGGFGLLDSSVVLAELSAAWAGITCAIRVLGARSLIIEGDSLTVIRWLRQDPDVCVPSNPLISDIRGCLQGTQYVQIRHVFREANTAADWIAARVADHSGFWRWNPGDPYPFVLSQILYSDTVGLTHPRLV